MVASLLSMRWILREWSPAPEGDVAYAIASAQNALRGLGFVLYPFGRLPYDLAELKLTSVTAWPPGLSLAYFLLGKLGLSPAVSTQLLAWSVLALGSMGWCVLMRLAGAREGVLYAFAAVVPWSSWPFRAPIELLTDHFIWMMLPWICALTIRWRERSDPSLAHSGTLVLLAALPVLFKYSAAPITLTVWALLAFQVAARARFGTLALSCAFSLALVALLALESSLLTGSAFFGKAKLELCEIELRKFYQLAALPFAFSSIALLSIPPAMIAPAALAFDLALTLILARLAWSARRRPEQARVFDSMLSQAGAAYLFFLSMTLWYMCFSWRLGFYHYRYLAHLVMGILYISIVPLTTRDFRFRCRRTLLLLIAWILFAPTLFRLKLISETAPNYYLPKSGGTGLHSRNELEFLDRAINSRGKPDFLIGKTQLGIEWELPSIAWKRFEGRSFSSSKPLRVMYIQPERRRGVKKELIKVFGTAARIRKIDVPAGLRLTVLEIEFPGKAPGSGDPPERHSSSVPANLC